MSAQRLSSRERCLQCIVIVSDSSKVSGLAVAFNPLPLDVAVNPALKRQLANERFDQWLIFRRIHETYLCPVLAKGLASATALATPN